MSMFTLYLFTVLTKVSVIMPIFAGVAVGVVIILLVYSICEEAFENTLPTVKKIIGFICLCMFIYILTPNMKELAFIYIVGKTTQNEQLQVMPDKAFEILNFKLDEYLQDMRPKEVQNNN